MKYKKGDILKVNFIQDPARARCEVIDCRTAGVTVKFLIHDRIYADDPNEYNYSLELVELDQEYMNEQKMKRLLGVE